MINKSNHNPFPSTAVARLAIESKELLTIETKALKILQDLVNDYLNRKDQNGQVICIVGEYGTGKTHLALETLKVIDSKDDSMIHTFYLDAPSDNFLELYLNRFIPELKKTDIIERVDEYYNDIIIEELEGDLIYNKLIPKIRERVIEASEIVAKIGLQESKLIRILEKKLKKVTKNSSFSRALLLLRNPNFEASIWDWFCGKPPTQILIENGINKTIDNDSTALETIGVLSFLYGFKNHRFVLIIDELEKVFSSTNVITESAILAFKKLFESIGKTKGLLVLSGLPEYYESLPEDAKQRVTKLIKPTELTSKEITSYVKKANNFATGRKVIKPFTTNGINYLAELTAGNARQVIRLCYHSFHKALLEKRNANKELIEEVAKDLFRSSSKLDVESRLSQVIDNKGWIFEKEKRISINEKGEITIDFWIPSGDDGNGIAIFLVQDVFSEKDSVNVKTSINQIENELSESKVFSLLITSGFISDKFSETIDSIERHLSYNSKSFTQEFEAIITGLKLRLEEEKKEDQLIILGNKINQIERQLSKLSTLLRDNLISKNDINNLNRTSIKIIQNEFRKIRKDRKIKEYPPALTNILRLIEDIDLIIFKPFGVESAFPERDDLRYLLNSRAWFRSDIVGHYFLAKELIYMTYNFIFRSTNSYENRHYDIKHTVLLDFEDRIFKPLVIIANEEYYSFEYTSRSLDKEANEIMKELYEQFDHNLKTLPRNLYRYLDKNYSNFGNGSDANSLDLNVLDISNTILANEFAFVIEKLVAIDKFITNSLFEIIQSNSVKNIVIDELAHSLRDHYTLKHSIWIFMKSINDYLNNSLVTGFRKKSRNKFLYEFCDIFDYEIIRPLFSDKRKMGSQIFYALRAEDNDYNLRRDYEYAFDELYQLINKLPKKTIRIIEDSFREDSRLRNY